MSSLTRFGVNRSRVTWLFIIGLLVLGSLQYTSLPKREDPAVTVRNVVVSAQAPGMSTERIENLVVIPIERKAKEIGEIDDISSLITDGSAVVNLQVVNAVPEALLQTVFQDIRNKMASLEGSFPSSVQGPTVNTDYGDVVVATIALTGEGFSHAEREVAAKKLQTHLYTLDNIAKVSLLGVQDEAIYLEFDSRKLAAVGVQIPRLLEDLRSQNVIAPAGEFDAGGTRLIMEANGDFKSIDDIENVLTKVQGLAGYIRLKDLVDVRRTYEDPRSTPAYFNGQPAVMVSVEMSDGADIQKVGKMLKAEVLQHEQTQPIGIAYEFSTYQEAKVTSSINGALSNVGQTFLVVFVVIMLFLGWRPALIVASIVPLAASFALIGMGWLSVDLEQISIAAVIISLGLLVDNGLVVVEDIQTKVKAGVDPKDAAIGAGQQFIFPLLVASVTTVSAFLPMLILDGTEGEYAFSLGAVVGLMLAGSWISAMYVLPALAAWFLPKPKARSSATKPKAFIRWYIAVLQPMLRVPWLVMLACFALVTLSAMFLFPQLKNEMFPLSERNQFLIYMEMPRGTSITANEASALAIEQWLLDESVNPEVSNTTVYIGDGGPRFFLSLDPADSDPANAFFLINTTTAEGADIASVRARRYLVENHPEARFKVKQLAMGGSESGIVEIELSGPDGDELLRQASVIENVLAKVPGIVQNENNWGNKVLRIVVNVAQDKARAVGVTSESVSEALDGYFSGSRVSEYREGDKRIPIIIRAAENYRDSLEDLSNVTLEADGQLISLDQVSDIQPALAFSQIRRFNQQRRIVISAKSTEFAADKLLAKIQPDLDALGLPKGYQLEIGGETKQSAEVNSKLGAGMPLALMVMLFALMIQFNSARRVAITFMTIPLVAIGAPVALLLLDRPMSFFALLGMISLAGIIINNAIVLVDQIDIELQKLPLMAAVISAAGKRITPILLTSLTTVLGLIPMAYAGGALFEPMATLMIGGLIVSSFLTLFFVPCVYYMMFAALRAVKP